MSALVPTAVYTLCLATSLACAILLIRRYLRLRTRLLLGFALGFGALAVNNLLLVADMVVLPQFDLWALRQVSAATAVFAILGTMIWERE